MASLPEFEPRLLCWEVSATLPWLELGAGVFLWILRFSPLIKVQFDLGRMNTFKRVLEMLRGIVSKTNRVFSVWSGSTS